jgi:hypothetical protein
MCTINGKSYIGKHDGLEQDNYLGSGKLLRRAIRKHGKENFTRIILERYDCAEDCHNGEKKWISLFNAVESPHFYNIAAGGEGGNTYGGLDRQELIELKVKLKKRKKRQPPVGLVSYLDLRTGARSSCTTSEFQLDSLKVGGKTEYIYITPVGNYSSLLVARNSIGIDMSTLRKRCLSPDRQITKIAVAATDHSLKEHDKRYIGRTFREAGYGAYRVDEIVAWDLNKLETLNIIK